MNMKSVNVKIVQLPHGNGLSLPAYQSANAAGLDLVAAIPVGRPIVLPPGGRAMIPTGIALALPKAAEAQVRPRSGLAARHGITVLNSPGTIDADYRGEVIVILVNFGVDPFQVVRGDRIAQLVVSPVLRTKWAPQRALDVTARGKKGFGSTGKGPIDKRRKSRP